MAITPDTSGKAFPPIKGIPFWDQAALEKVDTSAPGPGPNQGVGKASQAPGIITALPEDPYSPWPEELSLWDTIKLAGMRAPGIARVEGGRGRRVPSMIVPGASGSAPTFLGEDAVEFFIHLTIWTPKQWYWLQQLITLISPPPTALIRPKGIKVDYPGLALLNIYDIYVVRIAIPKPDEYQRGHIEIHCTEFLPFLNVGSGPLKPSAEVTLNPDGSNTVNSRPPPSSPLLNSIGPNP